VTFVRTVLGDIDPSTLGATDAHEHLVIDGGRLVEESPDFLLADVDLVATELDEAAVAGLGAAIDAMPIGCGRNPAKLAELSRRTGVHIVAATGLHHARFYPDDHWSATASADELAGAFVIDTQVGIDAADERTALVRRSPVRAGVVKVGGSAERLSERDRRAFEAAAASHHATGIPILTHCDGGTAALEQVEILVGAGVAPGHVALSHVDKIVDRGYHREIATTGALVVYDNAFRWGHEANGTLQLLEWALEDGRIDNVMMGLDAARQSYYRSFGGSPGLAWLLTGFARDMSERGLDAATRRRIFVDNPARAFAYAEVLG
jgi:phosphotriesterase-related protein